MAESSPRPTQEFLVWGQMLLRVRSPNGTSKQNPDAHRLLFSVADDDRKWLAWYIYTGGQSLDYLITAGKVINSAVIGAGHYHAGPLHMKNPITVEELAGPVMASRGGPRTTPSRKASLIQPHSSDDHIGFWMVLHGEGSADACPITIKRRREFVKLPSSFEQGLVQWIMTEPFSYPTSHLNILNHRFRKWLGTLSTG